MDKKPEYRDYKLLRKWGQLCKRVVMTGWKHSPIVAVPPTSNRGQCEKPLNRGELRMFERIMDGKDPRLTWWFESNMPKRVEK